MIWTKPKTWESTDMINISDWQRIEDNTRLIAEFYGMNLSFKTWAHTDFPTSSELTRMENNINALMEQTHIFQSKFDWNLLNDIESILTVLHKQVVELQFSIKRAGTFSAGQQLYFPLGGNL